MNKVIWKFPIETKGRQEILMPKGAEILCIQIQQDKPTIWALVEFLPPEKRIFEVFGTGHNIKSGGDIKRDYVGTYQVGDGHLVFHVFERIN